jgi:hypothetical protein
LHYSLFNDISITLKKKKRDSFSSFPIGMHLSSIYMPDNRLWMSTMVFLQLNWIIKDK